MREVLYPEVHGPCIQPPQQCHRCQVDADADDVIQLVSLGASEQGFRNIGHRIAR